MTVKQAMNHLRSRRLVFGDPDQIAALRLTEAIDHDHEAREYCPICKGSAVKECAPCDGEGKSNGLPCGACSGLGFILCEACDGTATYSAYQANLTTQAVEKRP